MSDACNYLVDSMGSKKKAASVLGISQSTLRNYLGFRGVPEQLKDLVPKTISRGEAIRITRLAPSISEGIEIANRISRYSTKARKRYLDALEEDPKAEHSVLKRMANYYKQKQKIRLELTSNERKFLAKLATERSMEPEELVHDIVKNWLSKKGRK